MAVDSTSRTDAAVCRRNASAVRYPAVPPPTMRTVFPANRSPCADVRRAYTDASVDACFQSHAALSVVIMGPFASRGAYWCPRVEAHDTPFPEIVVTTDRNSEHIFC